MNFPKYDAKKPGDNFASCSTYDRLHALQRIAVVRSQAMMFWAQKLKLYLNSAMAHWELYSANRYRSQFFLGKCVTIMHDKMDHMKTASLILLHKTKQMDGLMKLPVSVIGTLAHGPRNVRYTHYGLDIFAHDANYIVGSFAKILRDLERPPKSSSYCLFDGSRSSPLLEAVLSGAEMYEAALPQMSGIPSATTPLPPILNVQMDNTARRTKIGLCFAFGHCLLETTYSERFM